jgi:hypothetical protein
MKLLALVVGSYLTVMEYSDYRHSQLRQQDNSIQLRFRSRQTPSPQSQPSEN